jgi:hypothetical protein
MDHDASFSSSTIHRPAHIISATVRHEELKYIHPQLVWNVDKRIMVRGINNVSGVSCHLSSALQLMCHALVPLREALIDQYEHPVAQSKELLEFGRLFAALSLESSDPVDPTSIYKTIERLTSITQHDVGDVSTALSKLLEFIRKASPDSIPEWELLLNLCLFGGKTRQTIVGRKSEGGAAIIRTKTGKSKSMACPFPLVGTFESVEAALGSAFQSQVVAGYNWDRSGHVYDEERIQEEASQVSLDDWTTHKTLHLECLPNFWFLHVERFTYQDGDKTLSNPKVDIPSTLNLSKYLQDDVIYNLLGGVLHVTEDAIEEEGHYVVLLRVSAEHWILVDDDKCASHTQDTALELLGGAKDEQGHFLCGTLLVYGNEADDLEESQILDDLKRKLSEISIAELSNVGVELSEDVVGRRLSVQWTKGKLYTGIVESFDPSTGKHRVRYDDGDVKEYKLAKKTIQWVD